ELLKKIDVPKKQVQIEVLLFERMLNRTNDFGLNLLRIGTCASNTNAQCGVFNDVEVDIRNLGVFEYLLSRTKEATGFAAIDLDYRFLLSQDDIQINACPSTVALNQTTAVIEIEDEISVSTGAFVVPTTGNPSIKDAFARARYGIVIEVTPTI